RGPAGRRFPGALRRAKAGRAIGGRLAERWIRPATRRYREVKSWLLGARGAPGARDSGPPGVGPPARRFRRSRTIVEASRGGRRGRGLRRAPRVLPAA